MLFTLELEFEFEFEFEKVEEGGGGVLLSDARRATLVNPDKDAALLSDDELFMYIKILHDNKNEVSS